MGKTATSPRPILQRIFLSPDERRMRAGWRIFAQTILFLFFVSFFGTIYISVSIFLRVEEILAGSSMSGILGQQAVTLIAITMSVYLARRFFDRRSFISLGLDWHATALRDLLFGIALAGLIIGFVYLAEWALGWLTFEKYSLEAGNTTQVVVNMATMLVIYVIVAWQEELLIRGYWLQNISIGLNLIWGVLLSSLFFALTHFGNPNISTMAVLGLIAGGIFLAYGYIRTNRLWLPIGLHIGWNFFEGTIFGFQVSGLSELPRLIIQTVEGPEIITGGDFGPEAGLIILPALLLGAVIIRWYTGDRNPNAEN